MNIFLWILQVLLAIHTAVGAVWKFSNSAAETMPSLKAIPDGVWIGMGVVELLCAVGLILPAVYKPLAILSPIAALVIAAEMVLYCGLTVASGEANYGPMIYWIVVAAICAFIAYGRFVLQPV